MTELIIDALSGIDGPPGEAPRFPDPEPLKLDEDERKEIADTISTLIREGTQARQSWSKRHLD